MSTRKNSKKQPSRKTSSKNSPAKQSAAENVIDQEPAIEQRISTEEIERIMGRMDIADVQGEDTARLLLLLYPHVDSEGKNTIDCMLRIIFRETLSFAANIEKWRSSLSQE